jgi:subtilisin family serine protease
MKAEGPLALGVSSQECPVGIQPTGVLLDLVVTAVRSAVQSLTTWLRQVDMRLLVMIQVGLPATTLQQDSWETPRAAGVESLVDGSVVVSGELIVGVKSATEWNAVQQDIIALGGSVGGAIPRLLAIKVILPDGESVGVGRERFSTIRGARYVEYNGVGSAAWAIPGDPQFGEQWHLHNTGQAGGKPGADIHALEAWEIQQGSSDIVVAILDNGIDFDHPEFQGRLLPGWDFVHNDPDPSLSISPFPHGLYVAGTLAANMNNGVQVAGVDGGCTVLPLKVWTSGGVGGLTAFRLASGIDYAASLEADIASMSLGSIPPGVMLADAFQAAFEAGAVLFAAAGNAGGFVADENYPSAHPRTVSIGWTNRVDKLFPNSGAGTAVDFVAPGTNIATIGVQYGANDVAVVSGSSFATPMTAGVASLLLAENSFLSPNQVYEFLRLGADDQVGKPLQDTPGWDPYHGHGRVNAYQSLLALRSLSAGGLLAASPPTLPLADGGTWVIRIDAGLEHAGQPYTLLGSWSGTSGVMVKGSSWPLSLDRYLWHGLTKPNTEPLLGNVGVLDAEGKGVATLTVPGDRPAWMGGMAVHHAVAVFDGSLPRPLASPPLLVSDPVTVRFDLPASDVFAEDFEQGAPGWVFDNGGLGLWHLAADGECGARTVMAAYNAGPSSCSVEAGIPSGGVLRSPSFVMTGKWPFTLRVSMIRGDASAGPISTSVRIVDETGIATLLPQVWESAAIVDGSDGKLQERTFEIPHSSKLMGRSVHLEFVATSDGSNSAAGWLVDNIRVVNAGEAPGP